MDSRGFLSNPGLARSGTLVATVSSQPAPTILTARNLKPHRLLLMETPQMASRERGRRLVEALGIAGCGTHTRVELVRLPGGGSPAVVRQQLERLLAENRLVPPWGILINGGTKPMAVGAWQGASGRGRVLYVDAADPCELVDLESGEKCQCACSVPLTALLRAHGFETLSGAMEAEMDSRLVEFSERIASECPPQILADVDKRPKLIARPPELSAALERDLRRELPRVLGCAAGEKQWRAFLGGGWLEQFLWQCVCRHSVALGIESVVPRLQVCAITSSVSNELDLVFMHRMRLVVIECKTGGRRIIDALYKLATVVRQLRAANAFGVLAWSGGLGDTYSRGLARRAELLGCRLLDRQAIMKLARRPAATAPLKHILDARGDYV